MFVTANEQLIKLLGSQDAVCVRVQAHRGSVPRETGAWLAVFEQTTIGSVGGGHLEWQAIEQARQMLAGQPVARVLRYALGPSLGQCCGGEVVLEFERLGAQDIPVLQRHFQAQQTQWPPVALFGGGHVASALVRLLGRLPFQVQWIDSREDIFPTALPVNVSAEHSDPVHGAVDALAPGSMVLIMSFSHAEDLDVVAACLLRQRNRGDLPYVGLIGSRSKWAAFRHRLAARGFAASELSHVTSPIGVPGIAGKAPDVIAVAVAAQLLQLNSTTDALASWWTK